LIERLVQFVHPDRIHLDLPVSLLGRDQGGLYVEAGDRSFHPDAVVLATPAFESARLLAGIVPDASRGLGAIPYVSTAAVYLVYPEGTAGSLPEGSGFVVPQGRGTFTACTWVSRKWPNEAFGDRAVLRCFVGRAGDQDALDLEDPALVDLVAGEAGDALGLHDRPEITRVIRWHRAMPQYEVGHLDRVARIEAALAATPGVFVTGSALRGIGIADCIRQGQETAERVAALLSGPEAAAIGPTDEEQEAISWTS
jgi:oxygen-dependent protoporphyrinogen oxidase